MKQHNGLGAGSPNLRRWFPLSTTCGIGMSGECELSSQSVHEVHRRFGVR